MTKKILNLKETMLYLNVSKSTIHRWDKEGKLKPLRTSGGHRRYRLEDLNDFLGIENKLENTSNEVRVALYSRCSSSDQKQHGDIDRQSDRLLNYAIKNNYKITHIIKDLGSGMNDKRKGFIKLCNLIINKSIDKVIIEHKDRLTRFQYNLIELFFNSYNVKIELLDDKQYSENEELVNDMMMLIASFSGRLYSKRAKENRINKNK